MKLLNFHCTLYQGNISTFKNSSKEHLVEFNFLLIKVFYIVASFVWKIQKSTKRIRYKTHIQKVWNIEILSLFFLNIFVGDYPSMIKAPGGGHSLKIGDGGAWTH